MKTEPFKNKVITMDVYRGGISRIKNGELEQFEFAADAKTGTVVELVKNLKKTVAHRVPDCATVFFYEVRLTTSCSSFPLSSHFTSL